MEKLWPADILIHFWSRLNRRKQSLKHGSCWSVRCIGNSWGMDEESGRSCLGCGPQEEFYGCSDIAIGQPTDHEHTPPHHLLPLSPSHHQHHHQQQTQQHFSVRHPAGLFQSSSALASMSETERTSSFGQTEDLTESNELRRINPEEEVRRIHSSDGAKTSRVDEVVVDNSNRSSSSSSSSSFSSPWHRLSDPADQWTTGQEWTEVVFDGQRHNVSVIKRHPQRHMTSQQLPMSVDRLDLVPLGKREPVFVLPRWYMFEDRATKQITLVEPEVIKSTLKEMVKNGGQSGRSSGKTMTSGKNRSRGQMRSRDWKLIGVPAADSRMDGIERLLRIESTPISSDQWREEETDKDVTYSVDNSSPSSSIPSPPLSTPSSSPHPTPSPPSSSPPSPFSSSSPPPSPSTSPSLPPSQPSSYSSSAPSPSPSTPHFFPVTSSSRPASHPNEAAMSSSVKAGGEAENSAKISPAGREPEGGGRRRMERTTVAPNALHKILFISQRQARPWNKNSGRWQHLRWIMLNEEKKEELIERRREERKEVRNKEVRKKWWIEGS